MAIVFGGVFPPTDAGFVEKEDAGYYGISFEDNTIRSGTDGGYEFARKRFTRKPRQTFMTGFTEMTQADFDIFREFWEQFMGARSFTWNNPAENQVYTVRFASAPKISYVGVGPTRLYSVEVELKQV